MMPISKCRGVGCKRRLRCWRHQMPERENQHFIEPRLNTDGQGCAYAIVGENFKGFQAKQAEENAAPEGGRVA